MKYRPLGKSDLTVSQLCLGTMTFGQQNTESESHLIMDRAVELGINFFDTAEMYPVPANPNTQGATERFIGSWFQRGSIARQDIILATKVTGPSIPMKHISDRLGFSAERIQEAIDLSLGRLKTDYIDLYQWHWPERKTNYFGQLGFPDAVEDPWEENFQEGVLKMGSLLREGKIRHWGLSNETPWGVWKVFNWCDQLGVPRPITIQNPYSLLNRTFEVGLSEISIRERFPLLAYSPLGFGLLSGKYHIGIAKENDRLNQFKTMARYNGERSKEATSQYLHLAQTLGLSLSQMALAFVQSRRFMGATIIGATNTAQLEENVGSIQVELTVEILQEIQRIHAENPNPAP